MAFFDSVLKAIPVVGDVLSGIGSIFGASSQRDANKSNEANQREFAQHGIQWRVADARAAGLHPLYALGGAGATYTPSAQGIDFGAMGQNLSRAASAVSGEQRTINQAQLRLLESQARKTDMETAVLASEQARAEQGALASRPIPAESIANDYPVYGFAVPRGIPVPRAKPLEDGQDITAVRRDPSFPAYIAGADKAAFREWRVPGLGKVLLPDAENFAEALEALENPVNQAAIVAANVAHYGPGFREKMRQAWPSIRWFDGVGGPLHRWSIK